MPQRLHVSITGLQLRHPWQGPIFWFHTLRAMAQARKAPGNLLTQGRVINGVHHTLTVWTSEEAMRAYVRSGSHLVAMQSFKGFALGRVVSFAADRAPGWSEVPAIWSQRGRIV